MRRQSLPIMVASLYRQRGLIAVLVGRDLKARYRGTFFGFLWSLLNPLMLLAVYTVVFTWVIPAPRQVVVPFPLFLFAGLLPWLFASGALLDAAVVLPDNGPLLKKVVCPPEVFPTVTLLSHLVHHLLALPILLAGMAVAAVLGLMSFSWTLLLLPLAVGLWVLAVGGAVLAVSALAVHFRDLKDLLHNVLNLVFFLTPIIYTPEMIPVPALRRVIEWSPLTPLVTLYRDVVLLGREPGPSVWLAGTGVALGSALLGTFVFSRLRETLAEAA
ncbi:MAG: ABC transporter permease [Thermoanaerobaculaceae bacterium]|nr:ABC transporter permease [Thermoanaerobaculaceae bacterium]MDI9620470.1 ABC transporter permease [Acidobacteriota bacterium]HPW55714.1 ABC transporter permease [Thermoanaerobaculaceae bacterium]